ncbi:MAG: ROK family protein, partial [Planctomycetes bacterium]|nr:ROK family protein [Planctomycetota bacterium]
EAHQGQEHGLAQMCAAVRQAAAGAGLRVEQLAALGVGVPGTLDIPAGIILEPHNLKPWRNVPARRHLHDTFGLPTAFQNDANAAAYGEYKAGAGRGMRSLVLFTLGTGIGGGLILDDRIVEGEHSHGGEIGHILIETSQPRRCVCGRRGCLEAYAGATAVVQRTLEALKQDPGRSSLDSWLHRKDALTARDVFEAAAAGDALASKIVEETAFYLAVGAVNLMHTLDPDIVVFGGGMVAAGEPFLQRIRRHIEQLAFPVPAARTQIRFAQLGPDAGFIGAAGCGRQLQEVIRNQ